MAACSACYLNLAKTDKYLRQDPLLAADINTALGAGGLHYNPGSVSVRHMLEVVFNDVGLETIREKVVRPLKGLKVAPYYGCMVVRPDPDKRFRNPEYPMSLDEIMEALGARVIDFPEKAHCCSGHMTQISPDVAYELIRRLIHAATDSGADMMVTLCPMCQLNLDAYQADVNKHFGTDYHMPVLYFTQLMGLAFGHDPAELGLGKEFMSSRPALAKIGVDVPEAEETPEKPARRKKDDHQPTYAQHAPTTHVELRRRSHEHTTNQPRQPWKGTHWRLCLPLRFQHFRHGGCRRCRRLVTGRAG